MASGENQLTFHEHDRIALIGERAKGWQFGENLRTQLFGWFPVAYTEMERDDNHANWGSIQNEHQQNGHTHHSHASQQQLQQSQMSHHQMDNATDSSVDSTLIDDDEDEPSIPSKIVPYADEHSPTRMFGDTIMYRQSKHYRGVSNHNSSNRNNANDTNKVPKPGPPPTVPAPVPAPLMPSYITAKITQSHSFSSNGGPPLAENRKSMPATINFNKQVTIMSDQTITK